MKGWYQATKASYMAHMGHFDEEEEEMMKHFIGELSVAAAYQINDDEDFWKSEQPRPSPVSDPGALPLCALDDFATTKPPSLTYFHRPITNLVAPKTTTSFQHTATPVGDPDDTDTDDDAMPAWYSGGLASAKLAFVSISTPPVASQLVSKKNTVPVTEQSKYKLGRNIQRAILASDDNYHYFYQALLAKAFTPPSVKAKAIPAPDTSTQPGQGGNGSHETKPDISKLEVARARPRKRQRTDDFQAVEVGSIIDMTHLDSPEPAGQTCYLAQRLHRRQLQ